MPRMLGTAIKGEAEPSLEALREARLAAAKAIYDARRQTPLAWDFGATPAKDDAGVEVLAEAGPQTLQMRDDGEVDDLKNWLAAANGAMLAVMASAGAQVQPLKATSNLWVQTTAEQVLAVLVAGDGWQLSALQRGRAMLGAHGAIKKALSEAADASALAAVDIEAGYPA